MLFACRRLPWFRNFLLFFYSIPEVLQQSMAINTDSFLFVATFVLLALVYKRRPSMWTMVAIGLVVGSMTVIKPIYIVFGALAFIVLERLLAQQRWRWRDGVALAVALTLPYVMQRLWMSWLTAVVLRPSSLDAGRQLAGKQMAFFHDHPSILFPLMWHQLRDLFSDDLMRGSWLSIFAAFGWSMFTMKRWGYYLMLLGGVSAFVADAISAKEAPGVAAPTRWTAYATVAAAGGVFLSVVATIVGMYIYFSGAFLGRIGANEVIGVQGRYYLIAILLWAAMLMHLVRRRVPLPTRWATAPLVLASVALFCCALSGVLSLQSVLWHFHASYFGPIGPPPFHY
jgi:uncharacterized membrane protein